MSAWLSPSSIPACCFCSCSYCIFIVNKSLCGSSSDTVFIIDFVVVVHFPVFVADVVVVVVALLVVAFHIILSCNQ